MSETSLGIPVMPPPPPREAGPLPSLDVRIAPLVPPLAPVTAAAAPPADPEAQLAWKAERLDTLDYFELLGVATTASAGEVKRAFYRESRAYHPDRFFHLTDEAFKARYNGRENKNIALIHALKQAGVDLRLCGQGLQARKIERSQVNPDIQVDLWAMVTIVNLQTRGYVRIG